MAQTVFVNGRGVVHKASGGTSMVFPNLCKTPMPPGPPVPLPYPSIGLSKKTSKGPKKVKVDGQMPMVKGAVYASTDGDKPGTGGGVMSGCNGGEAEFMVILSNVKFEGATCAASATRCFTTRRTRWAERERTDGYRRSCDDGYPPRARRRRLPVLQS